MINKNPYGVPKVGPNTVEETHTLSTKARVAMFIFGWVLIVASFFCLGLVYLPWSWLATLHGQSGYLVVVRIAFALTMIIPIVYVGLGILRSGVITVADSIMHK
jgi:succinate dehydrogenase/fumarate reductase cytochrome b subunit